MIPYGILRTDMGVYVVNDDTCLSRWVEREQRLDIADNIVEIVSFAQRVPIGGVMIDAGASLGDHALSYSQLVGAEGHVYAFEPHPLTYQALARNMARLNNVTTFQLGLSDRAQPQQHFVCDPNIGASFLAEQGDVTIETVTLDEFLLPALERCDFVHLDAEGWEPRILDGGRALIERFHPLLLVEVCDKHLRRAGSSEVALLALLDSLGYRIIPIASHTEAELRDVLAVWGSS